MITFGGIMKLQMEKLDIKQEALAKELNIARTTVTAYCNDKRQPDFEMVKRICHKLQINLPQVLALSHYDNEDMILHDDYEYKVNQAARKIKKEEQKRFLQAVSFLSEMLKEN